MQTQYALRNLQSANKHVCNAMYTHAIYNMLAHVQTLIATCIHALQCNAQCNIALLNSATHAMYVALQNNATLSNYTQTYLRFAIAYVQHAKNTCINV